jgi:hypothetical protein
MSRIALILVVALAGANTGSAAPMPSALTRYFDSIADVNHELRVERFFIAEIDANEDVGESDLLRES